MLAAVTGAEGFIGSHLVEALVASGVRVRAMVLYNSFHSRGWLDTLAPDVLAQVDVVLGDVRDERSVGEFMIGADTVYHLAALIGIPYSYLAPQSYVQTNTVGTLNVLESGRRHETPRVIVTSTSEVYGTALRVPIDETHPLQAQSPYSATKIAADKLAEAYQLSFGLPVVTLRPFNTYGPRQSTRAVIPTIVAQLAAGVREVNLGAVTPTRDFTYVEDTASAFLAVGTAPLDLVVGHVLNAGTGEEISIRDLFGMIATLMRVEAGVAEQPERLRPPKSEVMRLVCNAGKLRELTGWQPAHDLESGLRRTIDWFKEPANLANYRETGYHV